MPEDMSDRMPEDLPVRKCINVMVGITRSKVLFPKKKIGGLFPTKGPLLCTKRGPYPTKTRRFLDA
jgi:hypothetical protein